MRAFFESVGYAIRANVEQIEALIGEPTRELFLSGGMARSAALVSLIRDISGVAARVAAAGVDSSALRR